MKARTLVALAALTTAMGCVDRVQLGLNEKDLEGEPVPATHTGRIDKVDLLFVVDNSRFMGDKQRELSRRVPEMIRALTAPPPGSTWTAVRDLHVAFITSSLGSYGTSACAVEITVNSNDDRAYPLPRRSEHVYSEGGFRSSSSGPVAASCPSPSLRTVLRWVDDPTRDPSAPLHGTEAIADLEAAASCIANTTREYGCEYEAPLEAMYRFLVDPAPYQSARVECTFGIGGDKCDGDVVRSGLDTELLAHRSAFLRPDSVVVVVLLTDENDASFRTEGTHWEALARLTRTMPRGNAACASVPEDANDLDAAELFARFGCRSCADGPTDPGCSDGWPGPGTNVDSDGPYVRALHNARRFGRNYLWPVQRYVDGLSKRLVPGSDGKLGANPLFATGARSLDMVMLAGIVGVPRALVENVDGSPRSLSDADWEKIASVDPNKRDPHMIESIAPRSALPRFAGDRSVDAVHGGDRDIASGDDLQYACIGPRDATEAMPGDCTETSASAINPICSSSGHQPYFKAYPSIRPLRTIRALGARGHVASICNSSYAAAVAGIAEKLHTARGSD